ncbi:MAG TPA: terminase small subunit [Bacillota bacterium]|jgi:hypothetical protein|nr:terminase small subunit [Bacillota bacterium]
MAGGRPLKFQSVEELQAGIDKYFAETPKDEWTVTGLALALDTTRELFLDYKDKPQFSDSISKAYLKVHNSYEIGLRKRGNAGDIFALKNFGWKDKNENEVYGKDGGPIDQSIKVEFVNGKRPDTSEV